MKDKNCDQKLSSEITDTDRLRELLEKATPGPWNHAVAGGAIFVSNNPLKLEKVSVAKKAEDAALIVEAINALPALLDELEAYRAKPEEWRAKAAKVRKIAEGKMPSPIDKPPKGLLLCGMIAVAQECANELEAIRYGSKSRAKRIKHMEGEG